MDVALSDFVPEQPDVFMLGVTAYLAPEDGSREDMFDFVVCSPGWIERELETEHNRRYGRIYVVLPRFDYQVLWNAVTGLCAVVEGPDWWTAAWRIGHYGLWEYDDHYNPQGWMPRPNWRGIVSRAELRGLDYPALADGQPADFVPEGSERFGVPVRARIGSNAWPDEEVFEFFVCSPNYLRQRLEHVPYMFGRGQLYLRRFDQREIWEALQDLCENTGAPDWLTLARYISRYGIWDKDQFYSPTGWRWPGSQTGPTTEQA